MAFPASLDKSCLGKNRSSVETGITGASNGVSSTHAEGCHTNSSLPVHLCMIILPTNDVDFDNTAAASLVLKGSVKEVL